MPEGYLGDNDDEVIDDLEAFEVVEELGEPGREVRDLAGSSTYAFPPAGPSAGDRRWLAWALLAIALAWSIVSGVVAPTADQELWARYQAIWTPWQTLLALAVGYFFAIHHKT